MLKKRLFITRTSLIAIITLFLSVSPLAVYADPTTTCTPPSSSQSGVHVPIGADASLYTYNCTTGLWQSSEFTFDPSSGTYTPITPVVYTYNASTGLYDAQVWVYSAPKNGYVQATESVSVPPAGADVVGGPAPTTPSGSSDSISGTGSGSNNTIAGDGSGGNQTISGTGDNSNNGISNSGNNNANISNTSDVGLNNQIGQQSSSGDVAVLDNTTAGNATSGNALDEANVVNMLQSSAAGLGSNVVTFTDNINGDVNGDFLLDPSVLGTPQNTNATPGNNNLTVNNSTNAAINNNIDLAAASGNTTADQNTTVGNVSSGSAEAIANVVNLINSAISSGQSFIGTININGDLNGNILVPQDFINQLLATNVPTVTISTTRANSNNSVTNNGSNTTNVTNTNNQGINNNVNANATSGQVDASQNTTAGNVTSGNANTNITAFNLTGSNVVGANDMLVFVNVMGTWVGMILNAPGATAAELGGGIVSNTGNGSNNTVTNGSSNNTNVNNNTNEQINNNINVNANSGNVNEDKNTTAGNATSGNADAAVNLLNVEGSTLSLANWFGILFINVFGTWNGNFGIQTPATASTSSGGGSATIPSTIAAFRFAPSSSSGGNQILDIVPFSGSTGTSGTATNSNGSSISASLIKSVNSSPKAPTPKLTSGHFNWLLAASGASGFVLLLIGDRLYSLTLRRLHIRSKTI